MKRVKDVDIHRELEMRRKRALVIIDSEMRGAERGDDMDRSVLQGLTKGVYHLRGMSEGLRLSGRKRVAEKALSFAEEIDAKMDELHEAY